MCGWVCGWVTLFVPTVTFKPLKLVLKFHMWIPHIKIANPCFFFFSELSPLLELWPFEIFLKKSCQQDISKSI